MCILLVCYGSNNQLFERFVRHFDQSMRLTCSTQSIQIDGGRVAEEEDHLMPFQIMPEFSNFALPHPEESSTTQLFNSIFAGSLYDYSLPPLPDTRYNGVYASLFEHDVWYWLDDS